MNASFFDKLQAARNIAAAEPSNKAIGELRCMLEDKDVFREFWRMLDRPNWIVPLRQAGYFASPTLEKREAWTPSGYLKRMAAHEPKLVGEILSEIETDNPNVLGDMIEAASAITPQVASSLAERISLLLDRGVELYMFHDKAFCQLVERLAREPSTQDGAFAVARALLFPKVKPQDRSQRHVDHHRLKAMDAFVPAMVRLKAKDTLQLLCEELLDAIKTKGEAAGPNPMFDSSYMWRPAIEEHGQNRTYDSAGRLVTPLRNAAEIAVREKHVALWEVLRIVRSFKYLIFHRLGVHLINAFAEANPDLARKTMMDKELFDDYRFKHEYAMLVGNRFDLLKPTEKNEFFAWIGEGPDMSGFDESVRSSLGREATVEDRENRKKHWQYARLWWIREHLAGQWKQLFDEMYASSGEPELADLNFSFSSSWGAESPIKARDLEGLALEAVLQKVLSWRPAKHERGEMLAEGLQDTFAAYVKQNVEACSRDARLMMSKPAMFVRPFISAMSDAVNQGKQIPLEPVFELCRWVTQQPREQDTPQFPTDEHELVDRDWQWCRERIGDFVEKCCEKDIPGWPEGRGPLWDILEPLTHDPDRNYMVDQEEEDVRTKSFVDHSINNPRGKAMHALFKYARWVGNHVKEKQDGREVIPGGFDAMPEVRNAIEKGLSEGEHDSFAVRAAYGCHLGLLYWVDKEWLASRVDQLFDLATIETDATRAYGWAAWNAFLVYIPPHIEYFNLLEKQFKYAVDQYQNLAVEEVTYGSPAGRLGEHLVILYGRGQLGLDDHDSLLRRFLSRSCQAIRSYAIAFVGQSLIHEEDESKEALPKEVLDRFVKLWEWYWPEVGSRDEEPSRDLFSCWYICRCFDRRWALEKLSEYVQRVPLPQPDFQLPERLAEDAELDPERVLSIMAKMIEADKQGWRLGGRKAEIEQILSVALKADKAIRAHAVDLINRWGRRGWISLGELLRAT